MFREIYEEFDKANHPEKAYLNQFEDTLKSWVKGFLKDDARIALFIDDLDRCMPQVTLEVLEAIKLYLNIPQIIFVVGLDRSVVDDAQCLSDVGDFPGVTKLSGVAEQQCPRMNEL
jgi:predicted KAP-like P-loop ATPase